MDWLGFAVVVVILVAMRKLVLFGWLRHRIGPHKAAAFYAAVIPLAVLVMIGLSGYAESPESAAWVLGITLLVFACTYAWMQFLLRAMGGEWDPPASSSHKT